MDSVDLNYILEKININLLLHGIATSTNSKHESESHKAIVGIFT